MIENWKLGSDPELFLRRKDTGDYFPAIGLIEGTKNNPTPMEGLSKGFTWQIDGMALEFNTPPANTKEQWVNNHKTALNFIKQNIDDSLFEIRIDAVAEFNDEYFNMPGARELGCSVDYNAWLQCTNPRPDADGNIRSSAGHVHLGALELKDQSLVEQTVKVLDLFLGVPSVLIDPERERRKLYGKAGCFRFGKSYVGLEYRSLSNFWLKSEELMGWVYDNTKLAIDFLNSGKTINEEDEQIIQTAMNEYNEDYCKYLVEKYNIEMPVKQLVTV